MNYLTKKFIILSVLGVLMLGLSANAASALTLKERDETARIKYNQAKQTYLNEVNFYKTSRQSFLNARQKYTQLRNGANKTDLELKAREFLKQMVSVMIKRLEALKNKVGNHRAIPDAERQSILAEIDQDINWLKERQSAIDTATPEQIKETAKEIRDYWKNTRVKVKRVIGLIWAARINFLITKAEGFSTKIAAKIAELKAAGKDTSQLEAWLDEFNQKISLAKEKYQSAKEKFSNIAGASDLDELFKAGHQFIKDAHNYLKEAHRKLIEIVREMKKMGTKVTPSEVTPAPEETAPPTEETPTE